MPSEGSEDKDRQFKLFAEKEDKDDSLFTPWSLVHFTSGAAACAVGVSFSINFLVHAVYEMKDLQKAETVYNSKINSVGDQFASMAGHYIAKKGQMTWVWVWLASFFALVYSGDDYG